MSICAFCLQGLCRKHPLQDHGQREAELKKKLATTVPPKTSHLNDLLNAQIARLQSQRKGTQQEDNEDFRHQLANEREQLLQSKRPSKAKNSEDIAGLNPSVARLMMSNYDSENEREKEESKKKRKRARTDEDSSTSSSDHSSDDNEIEKSKQDDQNSDDESKSSGSKKKRQKKKSKKNKRKHKKEKKSKKRKTDKK